MSAVKSYEGLSTPARQVVQWLAHQKLKQAPIALSAFAEVVGSRRAVPGVVAEMTAAGFIRCNANEVSILESTFEMLESVGHDEAHPSPREDAKSEKNLANSLKHFTPKNSSLHATSQNSRLRCSDEYSISEGNTYEALNSDVLNLSLSSSDLKNKEINKSEEKKKRSRARARGPISTQQLRSVAQERAKQTLIKSRAGVHEPIELILGEDCTKARAAALAYEDALGQYLHKPALKYITGRVAKNEPNFQHWLRAAQFADELSVDYSLYMRAQFWCFDKWYSRAPKPHEIASYKTEVPAQQRVRLYIDALGTGDAVAYRQVCSRELQVVDTTTPTARRRENLKVSVDQRLSHAQQQLQSLMKNYNATEEQILRIFAKGPSAQMYFDRAWLLANPIYQQLKAAGEL